MSSGDIIESAYAANPNLKKRIFDALSKVTSIKILVFLPERANLSLTHQL